MLSAFRVLVAYATFLLAFFATSQVEWIIKACTSVVGIGNGGLLVAAVLCANAITIPALLSWYGVTYRVDATRDSLETSPSSSSSSTCCSPVIATNEDTQTLPESRLFTLLSVTAGGAPDAGCLSVKLMPWTPIIMRLRFRDDDSPWICPTRPVLDSIAGWFKALTIATSLSPHAKQHAIVMDQATWEALPLGKTTGMRRGMPFRRSIVVSGTLPLTSFVDADGMMCVDTTVLPCPLVFRTFDDVLCALQPSGILSMADDIDRVFVVGSTRSLYDAAYAHIEQIDVLYQWHLDTLIPQTKPMANTSSRQSRGGEKKEDEEEQKQKLDTASGETGDSTALPSTGKSYHGSEEGGKEGGASGLDEWGIVSKLDSPSEEIPTIDTVFAPPTQLMSLLAYCASEGASVGDVMPSSARLNVLMHRATSPMK